MSMLRKLFAIEWIKMRRRSVFWIVIVVHATVISAGLGGQQYMHHLKPKNSPFRLPADWMTLISVGAQMGMLMLLIGIALLTASETTWKTQRQNVIDGLSRAQYFTGKVFVVVMLAGIVWVDIMLLGIIFASLGGSGALTMPVFSDLAQRMLPNVLLYFVAIGITGLMFGMLASSSGAALALSFAYMIIEPVVGGIMASQGGQWPKIVRFLPLDVFGNLIAQASYDSASLARMTAMYEKMGRPRPLSLSTSVTATAIYIVAFIGLTWLAFRKRDL